jgi:hypothetical protein
VGVLQRLERRLEGVIEGAFARVFRGSVEPVEVAKALQREAADRKTISATRTLVPNTYVVELGRSDHARLKPYEKPLGTELAAMVREHAADEGWSFVGPVEVSFEEQPDLGAGMFRVRSDVLEGTVEPTPALPQPGRPRLTINDGGASRELAIGSEVVVIGRASNADVRLSDTGVSRRHAEVRREGDDHVLVDLGSTNGTLVNGRPIERVRLANGDRIELGATVLLFERDRR